MRRALLLLCVLSLVLLPSSVQAVDQVPTSRFDAGPAPTPSALDAPRSGGADRPSAGIAPDQGRIDVLVRLTGIR